jgi:hypothetical protein
MQQKTWGLMQLHNSWIFVLKSEKVKSQSEQKTKTKFSFLVKTKAQDFWHIAAVIPLADTQFLYIYIHTHTNSLVSQTKSKTKNTFISFDP